ncbi:hypothetical protein HanXRQr2_Chr10g0455331 [Helianthus annuus]|uniref:Uncharacterized protein n=1 Tax=Helianthus annuus TaxID=4232 RepID=A0A9K3I0B9_HELAN|nr:hypothetical protein HanXRQr2_Chr10g0455331 [Helianthus annuus]KAJ0884952.1 hypothetical protein HanPSC8_Chr10g0439771 [Helianthus annuus]
MFFVNFKTLYSDHIYEKLKDALTICSLGQTESHLKGEHVKQTYNESKVIGVKSQYGTYAIYFIYPHCWEFATKFDKGRPNTLQSQTLAFYTLHFFVVEGFQEKRNCTSHVTQI